MAREPHTKGTSVLPLVTALKNLPNARELLTQDLWRYLDDRILVSEWYPERELYLLLEAFVGTIDPRAVGGDTWHFFGCLAAKRDIGGSQEEVSEEFRTETQGLYRGYAQSTGGDVETFVKRSLRLWSQYHDTGSMEVRGGRVKTNTIVVRLLGMRISCDGYVRLQCGYLEEYGRLVGVTLKGRVASSTARGDPFCEWEYVLARTPASEAYVASLPPLPE